MTASTTARSIISARFSTCCAKAPATPEFPNPLPDVEEMLKRMSPMLDANSLKQMRARMEELRASMPPGSYHPGGVNLLMGDGSVRFMKDTVNQATWRALGTIQGGEVISADSY